MKEIDEKFFCNVFAAKQNLIFSVILKALGYICSGIGTKNRIFVVPYHNLWQPITVHSAVTNFSFLLSLHLNSIAMNEKWPYQRTEPPFCCVHFILTNVPVLHISLFTVCLLLINIKCLTMHEQH